MTADEWDEGMPEDETNDADIQTMLDTGYEQLDAFVGWLEDRLGVDTRTAQQECFNAEQLIDFLANKQRKTAVQVNEFDIRWFVFSHYIRHVHADPNIEERLSDSLRRFYTFLEAVHGYINPDWLFEVLDDRTYYLNRRKAYTDLNNDDERAWEVEYRAWCAELEDHLDARDLWMPRDMGEGMNWGDMMGWREDALRRQAHRRWLEERSELLAQGLDMGEVRHRLLESYYYWLDDAQFDLEDSSPRSIVREERAERADYGVDETEGDDGEADDMD